MKGSWTKFWTITGLILVILLAGTHVSAFMNPAINIADIAGLRYDGVSYPVNDTLIFNGTVNPDGGETVAVWRWDVVGPLAQFSDNRPVYPQMISRPGIYDVTLTVTSDTGLRETATQRIVMNDDRTDWGLIADYIYSVDRTTPLMVSLIDQSQFGTGTIGSSVGEIITDWYWILDGELISTNSNPSEVSLPIEMTSGTDMDLALRIDTNLGRKSFIQKRIQINPRLPAYNVLITLTADNGGLVAPLEAPMTVRYGAQASINGMSPGESQSLIAGWQWYLGVDEVSGTIIFASEQNPVYTYDKPGRFIPEVRCFLHDGTVSPWFNLPTVISWVNADGSFDLGPPLEADFYWEPITLNPTAGYLYRFVDTSHSEAPAGVNSWSWNFGDGGITNPIFAPNDPNVTHLFKEPGTYSVTLEVIDGMNPFVPNVTEKTYNLNVINGYHDSPMKTSNPVGGLIQAGFNTNPVFGTSDTFSFTDTSFGPITSWVWDFGDGTTQSTVSNPEDHRYFRAGTYKVTLTVSDGNLSDSAEVTLGVR